MLVLLWGLAADPPLAAIREQLQLIGAPTVFVDQREVANIDVELTVSDVVHASLRIADQRVDLNEVAAAYLRPYQSCRLPAIASAGPDSAAWRHAANVDDILTSWAEITPALLVNPLDAMSANNSKPYQLEQLSALGWKTPETLITTEPEAARIFWERHGSVIYKSVSGVRSQVSRLSPRHLDRFESITSCPTQFQQYIAGTDHRVHVVGSRVFACQVLCDADDYRYPGAHDVDLRACELPREIEERCRITSAAMRLPLVGIDLRLTPEGEWFCFEANPSPGFTFYEQSAGLAISEAVAVFLTSAGDHHQPHFATRQTTYA
jgi:glutathione synthase/RimK-type ligase-like ATP-grasp enzyme